jgi:hypothetical protein
VDRHRPYTVERHRADAVERHRPYTVERHRPYAVDRLVVLKLIDARCVLTMTSATPDVLSTLFSNRALRAPAFSLRVDTHRVAALRPHAPQGASDFPTGHSRASRGIPFPYRALTLLTGRHAALRAARAHFSRCLQVHSRPALVRSLSNPHVPSRLWLQPSNPLSEDRL